MTHLWEVDHPYYCAEGNYYSNDCTFEHDSWADYLDEFGDADKDYNLVFRWDWQYDRQSDKHVLALFHMHQRKGRFVAHIVSVKASDEDSVREYLTGYAEHMRLLWAPLL